MVEAFRGIYYLIITGRYGRTFIPYSARSEIDAAPNFKVLRYFNLLECEVSIYEFFSEIMPVTVRDGQPKNPFLQAYLLRPSKW